MPQTPSLLRPQPAQGCLVCIFPTDLSTPSGPPRDPATTLTSAPTMPHSGGSGSTTLRAGFGRARRRTVCVVKGHFLWMWQGQLLGLPSTLGSTCWAGLIRALVWEGGGWVSEHPQRPFSPSLSPRPGQGVAPGGGGKQGRSAGKAGTEAALQALLLGPSAVSVHLVCGLVWVTRCPDV